MKRNGVRALACLVVPTLIGGKVIDASAQTAGSNVISVGWLHIAPQTGSSPLTVQSIGGVSVNQPVPYSSGGVERADTLGFAFEHYFTDHFGVATMGGLPTYLHLEARGSLEQFGVLGKGKPWSPTAILRYHLGAADDRFRVYGGLGVTYSWFTNVQTTNQTFMQATYGPGSSASVHLSNAWSPVFELGATYAFDKHWMAGVGVSYIPANTTATIDARTAAGVTIVTTARLRIRPVNTFVSLAYCF